MTNKQLLVIKEEDKEAGVYLDIENVKISEFNRLNSNIIQKDTKG